jgi:hypothetical protein
MVDMVTGSVACYHYIGPENSELVMVDGWFLC